ncbi:MAG: protein-disulfide reductase DsbD domain-containing protein, partial [Pseudomonadota bacterium]
TYWRYPGEAGIPPQITLTDTENLREVEILYPVPERYSDGFSESIVYHDGIVLPIRITPEDAKQKVRVDIDLFFGICKDICVPGDATLALNLDPSADKDTLAAKLIERDLANVPHTSEADGLKIESVSLTGEDRLVIETRVKEGSTPELFVAGPEGSYIGLAKLASQSGNQVTWHLSTKGLKSGKDDDHLRLVLAIEGKAIEHLEPIQPAWVN